MGRLRSLGTRGREVKSRLRMRPRKAKKFSDLSPPRQVAVLSWLAVQLGLFVSAEVDIQRRPASEVRRRKNWWRLVCLINFLGPLSYFRWGRREGCS
jgi:hypothetical protein